MEKRKLTKSQQELLKGICNNGKYVIVSGITSNNEPFTVKGRITHTDKNEPGVSSDYVWLEFGEEKDSPNRKQTKWFAPYGLNIRDMYLSPDLVVETIKDENGNIIYHDNKFEEIKKVAEQNAIKSKKHNMYRQIDMCDKVTEELKKLIGHPITLDGTAGILVCCDHVANNGSVCVDVLDGPLGGGLHVEIDSVLKTIDENGKEVFVAENDWETAFGCAYKNKPTREDIEAEKVIREEEWKNALGKSEE